MVKVGFAQVDITPPLGTLLEGYLVERPADGVHDNLYGRTIIIDNKGELFCLVQLDIINVDNHIIDKLYERISSLGLMRDNLIIGATHTHSGPVGTSDYRSSLYKGTSPKLDVELVERIVEELEKSINLAFSIRKSCTIEIGVSNAEGICAERHNKDFECDERLFVMKFIREDDKKVLYYNFSCHPTIMHDQNLKITSDLPYGVNKYLGDSFDMIVFTNGSAGDISTRFTRKESSFEEVYRLGSKLGAAIEETISNPVYNGEIKNLKIKKYSIDLDLKEVKTVEILKQELLELEKNVEEARRANIPHSELRLIESLYEGAQRELQLAESLPENINDYKNVNIEFSILRINDWNFITVPGEIFSTLTKPIREVGNNIILGYTNGYYSYIIDEKAYAEGYYEASSTPFKRGEGEKMVSFIMEKLKEDF